MDELEHEAITIWRDDDGDLGVMIRGHDVGWFDHTGRWWAFSVHDSVVERLEPYGFEFDEFNRIQFVPR